MGSFGAKVRFIRVPEKVPKKVLEKVSEKVWVALVQSQVRFNRVTEKVALVQSEVEFNRGSGEGSGEGLGGFGAEPGQVQQGFGRRFWKRFRKRSGPGFGAEPGQIHQGTGEGLGGLRLNRVPEKIPKKAWEVLVQRLGSLGFRKRFRKRFWRRFGKLWYRDNLGSLKFVII